MGVYIKGFRKPTYCQECPLTFDYDCMIQHEERDSLIDQYKHCPLVEVKTPHGRLIDADVLYQPIAEAYGNGLFSVESVKGSLVGQTIANAPTVIEAEVE